MSPLQATPDHHSGHEQESGTRYFYFLCRGRQDHRCDLPYLPVSDVEEAVERHYATVALPTDLRQRITESIDNAMADDNVINDERRTRIKKQLAKLDHQYLDLVGTTGLAHRKA